MVSSTVGSSTKTGWKRRASAASFSTCLRYSSSVVAPTQWSSPRASAGLSRFEASIAPSALPAPTSVCISSMNRMIWPSADVISLSTAFRRSSNSPRYLAPAISAPMSSDISDLFLSDSGTSPLTMRMARPFGDGGLADAGLADQHGIVLGAAAEHLDGAADFLVAADHRVELAARGPSSVRSRAYFLSASYWFSAEAESAVRPLRKSLIASLRPLAVTPAAARTCPASVSFSMTRASSSRSTVTKESPAFSAAFSAVSKTRASSRLR